MRLKRFNESIDMHEDLDEESLKEVIESIMDKYDYRNEYEITKGFYDIKNNFQLIDQSRYFHGHGICFITYKIDFTSIPSLEYNINKLNDIKKYCDSMNTISNIMSTVKTHYNCDSEYFSNNAPMVSKSNRLIIIKNNPTIDDYYSMLFTTLKSDIGDMLKIRVFKKNDGFYYLELKDPKNTISILNLKHMLSIRSPELEFTDDQIEIIDDNTIQIKDPKYKLIKFTYET